MNLTTSVTNYYNDLPNGIFTSATHSFIDGCTNKVFAKKGQIITSVAGTSIHQVLVCPIVKGLATITYGDSYLSKRIIIPIAITLIQSPHITIACTRIAFAILFISSLPSVNVIAVCGVLSLSATLIHAAVTPLFKRYANSDDNKPNWYQYMIHNAIPVVVIIGGAAAFGITLSINYLDFLFIWTPLLNFIGDKIATKELNNLIVPFSYYLDSPLLNTGLSEEFFEDIETNEHNLEQMQIDIKEEPQIVEVPLDATLPEIERENDSDNEATNLFFHLYEIFNEHPLFSSLSKPASLKLMDDLFEQAKELLLPTNFHGSPAEENDYIKDLLLGLSSLLTPILEALQIVGFDKSNQYTITVAG